MAQAVRRLCARGCALIRQAERGELISFAACLLLSMAGTPSVSPLGAAGAGAAYLFAGPGCWELFGALLGALIFRRWPTLMQLVMFIALRLLTAGQRRLRSREKLLLILSSGLLTVPFFYIGDAAAIARGAAEILLLVLYSAVFCRTRKAIKRAAMGRGAGERDITALLLTIGAACCAAAEIGYGAISLGGILAALASLVSCSVLGVYSIAAAAVAGAGVVIGGGQLAYAGALAIGALAAHTLSRFGRAAAAAAFLAAATLCGFHARCLTDVLIQAGSAAALYLCIPARHLARAGRCMRFGHSEAELRLIALRRRVKEAAAVLDRVSELVERDDSAIGSGFAARQLRCMSGAITAIPDTRPREDRRFALECGMASCPRHDSEQAGDSMAVRELEAGKLILLSDGMGSGALARRESSTAVSLLGDLLAVGVDELDALDCVNRLMMERSEPDMYATLDAMAFDYHSGSARFIKLAAPPSYILRSDRVIELCAEALPIGIIAGALPARQQMELCDGDMVFMLSDGVSDALEEQLISVLTESSRHPPRDAARVLLESAMGRGLKDDMSVIALRVRAV